MSFVHLHVHSEFSLLQSAAKIKNLVQRAVEYDQDALAITDIDAMHGVIPFYKECKKQGIKPIIGVELSYKKELDIEQARLKAMPKHRLLFLAKNNQGYQALLKLTTAAQTREGAISPYITYQDLTNYLSEVIIIVPFKEGEIQQHLEDGNREKAECHLKELRHLVGIENVYIEIQNHWMREERERLLSIRDWIQTNSIPVVATNHVHFITKEQVDAHRVLQAIRIGEKLSALHENLSSPEYIFKNEAEMKEVFPTWAEAIQETKRIAERCNVEIPLGEPVLPHFPVPDGTNAKQFLRELCEKGVKERYSVVTGQIKSRMDYELSVISAMGYEDYFLIVADFMNYAHENQILTGPGRGSAAGSIVAYVLKITNVDPIKYHLLFERFLNPERISMPDIDIDFPDHQRDKVIQYVSRKYGKNHVAQIITFGTLATKAALRDSGRVLDIASDKIDRVIKLIPGRPNIQIREAVKENPHLKEAIAKDEELIELFRIAQYIEGLPRHSSIHAAGVVISRVPLTEVVPLQIGHEGLYLTQYPMGDLEDIGLIKMDFLGLRNLSFIDQMIKLVAKNRGISLHLPAIPYNDEKTYTLLGTGDTTGVFQLESSGMRNVLKRLQPTEFEDIVAVNALYRPGPMENIPNYIARKHGKEKITYPHIDLETILKPTYGVIIYQEQIIQIASKMAGFSLGEADVLRRAVGKKKREVLEETRDQFVKGSTDKGYSVREAQEVYDLIVRFADYGFNRSHAVAYSMISYQLAFLKANYRIEFLSGLMAMSVHHQDKLSEYIAEARRTGISVEPPSIHKSSTSFQVKGNSIWIGLSAIKNIGLQTVDKIIEERKRGPFTNLFHLCDRIPGRLLPKRALEALVLAGALDDFGVDRATLLASLDDALEYGEKQWENRESGHKPLFYEEDTEPTYTEVSHLSKKDRLRFEKEVLGFYASGHPIEEDRNLLREYDREYISKVKGMENNLNYQTRISGMVENIRIIQTKRKEQMAFIHLSDETGEIELTVFPKQFLAYQMKLKKDELIFVEGKVQDHKGERKVIANKCTTLEALRQKHQEKMKPILYLNIPLIYEKKGSLQELKKILQNTPGEVPVVLKYESTQKAIRLTEMWNVSADKKLLNKLAGVLGGKNVFFKKSRV